MAGGEVLFGKALKVSTEGELIVVGVFDFGIGLVGVSGFCRLLFRLAT